MLLAAEQKYSQNNCETREDRTQITAGKKTANERAVPPKNKKRTTRGLRIWSPTILLTALYAA